MDLEACRPGSAGVWRLGKLSNLEAWRLEVLVAWRPGGLDLEAWGPGGLKAWIWRLGGLEAWKLGGPEA